LFSLNSYNLLLTVLIVSFGPLKVLRLTLKSPEKASQSAKTAD